MCVIIHKPANKRVSKRNLKKCWKRNDDGAGLMYVENGKVVIEKGFMKFSDFFAAYQKHRKRNLVLHMRLSSAGVVNKENTHPFYVNDELGMCHNGTITSDFITNELEKYEFKQKIHKLKKRVKKVSGKKKSKRIEKVERVLSEPVIDLTQLFGGKKVITTSEWSELVDKLDEELDEVLEDIVGEDATPVEEKISLVSDTKVFNDEILRKLPKDFLKNPILKELVKQYCERSCLVFLDNKDKVTILGEFSEPIKVDGCWFSNDSWKETYSAASTYYPPYLYGRAIGKDAETYTIGGTTYNFKDTELNAYSGGE